MIDNNPLERSYVLAALPQRLTPAQIGTYSNGCRFTVRMLVTNTFRGRFWRKDLGHITELADFQIRGFSLTDEGVVAHAMVDSQPWDITHSPSAFRTDSGEEFFCHVPHFSEVSYRPIGKAKRWAVTLPLVFRCQGHPRHMREGETTFTSLTELARIKGA